MPDPDPEFALADLRGAAVTFGVAGKEAVLEILMHLARSGELKVGDLALLLDRPQPQVSSHLGDLRRAGIVASHRVGRTVRCSLTRKGKVLVKAAEVIIGLEMEGEP